MHYCSPSFFISIVRSWIRSCVVASCRYSWLSVVLSAHLSFCVFVFRSYVSLCCGLSFVSPLFVSRCHSLLPSLFVCNCSLVPFFPSSCLSFFRVWSLFHFFFFFVSLLSAFFLSAVIHVFHFVRSRFRYFFLYLFYFVFSFQLYFDLDVFRASCSCVCS